MNANRLAIASSAAMALLALTATSAAAQDEADRFAPPAYVRLLEYVPYSEAINSCDQQRFLAAKARLLAVFEKEVAANPGNARMREDLLHLQVELLPDPCPPDRSESYNAGLDWAPVRDIRFRGSYSRAVRAPHVIELFGSTRTVDIGETGIAVRREGPIGQAPERDGGLTDGKITLFGGGGALHLGTHSFHASFERGSGETLFDLQPIVGGFNGLVFGGFSEAGSTGTGAGSAAVEGFTRTQVTRFKVGGDTELFAPLPRSRVFFAYDYFRNTVEHDMSAVGTVIFPTQTITFSQQREQRVSDNFFAAGLGAEAILPFGGGDGGAGLSARIIAVTQAYLLDSNFAASETNTSNFGPLSDRNFILDFRQSEQTFGLHARGQINLEYTVSPRFAIFAGGTAEWFSDAGAASNPNSGDQVLAGRTTSLVDREFWSYGAVIGLRAQIR